MIAECIMYRAFAILLTVTLAASANTTELQQNENTIWSELQHYDIWSSSSRDALETKVINRSDENEEEEMKTMETVNQSFDLFLNENTNDIQNNQTTNAKKDNSARNGRAPVNGECLSEDGRRIGSCLNPYVCRSKGGLAKGECALGFGVCCIFLANCNETIANNITYLVSPNFPSFMPNNVSTCIFKVKLINQDISQLRMDFQHFSLGQPNRRTGVCDGDIFKITGGLAGAFTLCGQNSGQHMYYDVVTRSLPRQALYGNLKPLTLYQLYPNLSIPTLSNSGAAHSVEEVIEITMQFSKRFLPIRLWEIRISQIPFSQRAPAGCLQFHTGAQGIIQTFNYAENGRHLANQNYRICIRQEVEMCSIMYEPCDEQSFRIGPSNNLKDSLASTPTPPGMTSISTESTTLGTSGTTSTSSTLTSTVATPSSMSTTASTTTTTSTPSTTPSTTSSSTTTTTTTAAPSTTMQTNSTIRIMSSTAVTDTTTAATITRVTTPETTMAAITTSAATTTEVPELSEGTTTSHTTTTSTTTESNLLLSDDVEGSGSEEDYVHIDGIPPRPSRRPRPIRGGFDLLGFLRSAFDFRLRNGRQLRDGRQFFSTCSDRITMPCIVEDFIGAGLGPLPGCEPVHCGAQFCSSGVWPCRIESTVTPFYLGIHFGSGNGKGSAEDNIGACIRYTQVQCL